VTIHAIRAAYDALGTGDVEPLVSLMDEEMEWRGRRRGWRIWRPPPSWRGPDEAREVLTSGIEFHRRQGAADWQLEDVRDAGDKVAVAYSWRAPGGSCTTWAQVLTLSGGKIVAMRDYASPARALRVVGVWSQLNMRAPPTVHRR